MNRWLQRGGETVSFLEKMQRPFRSDGDQTSRDSNRNLECTVSLFISLAGGLVASSGKAAKRRRLE